MSRKCWIVMGALMLATPLASGWQSGATESYRLNCDGLITNEAEQVYLRVTAEAGSYGTPYLVGTKGDTEIWRHRFPAEEVNLAKFSYSCKRNIITLSSSGPGPTKPHSQTFVWNGAVVQGRIEFSKGTVSWEAYRKTSKGQEDHFLLWARQGQKIEVKMRNRYAPARFSIYSPRSSAALHDMQSGKQEVLLSDTLNETGDYRIVVKAPADDSYYYLQVRIE